MRPDVAAFAVHPCDIPPARLSGAALFLVVKATLNDFELLNTAFARHAVHQSMLSKDTPRPEAGEIALQRFRLSEALEG